MKLWKKLRYRSLLIILTAFLAIGAVLFAERKGIRYKTEDSGTAYLRETVVTSEEAAETLRPVCLLLTDKTSESSQQAATQFRRIFMDMKVGYTEVDVSSEDIPAFNSYETVTVLLSDLTSIADELPALCEWVENGGDALFAVTIQKNAYSDLIERKLGIISSGYDNVPVKSICPDADFMLGGGQSYTFTDPFDSAWAVELEEKAVVRAREGEKNIPLVWENEYGDGKFVVDNIGIYEKAVRGFYAASYSLLTEVCAYPVINGSVFYLDDFPSPVPAGDGTYIHRDYGTSISDFYTNIWWPDMMNLAEKHGIRYTGVLIENYEDNTSVKVVREKNTGRFQYFGNMLLHTGGEIGYHGYNHQPLCLDNVDYGGELPYATWESYNAMKKAVSEMVHFGKEMFPTEELSVYVPPSNIISQEGRKMLADDFPEIKAIASNYFPGDFAYEQEFEVASDQMVELPRVISGCQIDDYMQMAALSELNMHLVNSHFMHPDDLLDEDRGAKIGWEKLKNRLSDYMDWLYEAVPSLRNLTGSESAGAVQRYGALTVDAKSEDGQLVMNLGNFYDEAYLMVRANEGIPGKVKGGELEKLTEELWLLHATDSKVIIEWAGE